MEGLDGRLNFRALVDHSKLLQEGVECDLADLGFSWPGLAERVKSEGVLLDAAA